MVSTVSVMFPAPPVASCSRANYESVWKRTRDISFSYSFLKVCQMPCIDLRSTVTHFQDHHHDVQRCLRAHTQTKRCKVRGVYCMYQERQACLPRSNLSAPVCRFEIYAPHYLHTTLPAWKLFSLPRKPLSSLAGTIPFTVSVGFLRPIVISFSSRFPCVVVVCFR